MPETCKMKILSPPNMKCSNGKGFFTTKGFGGHIGEVAERLGLPGREMYMPVQRHTDKVVIVENDLSPEIADAVITRRRGLLIGVQVADCVPVLLFDERRSVIGAVHAGWRGTASQITKKAIKRMIEDFSSSPEDIRIAIGPSIKRECYEVGREVKDAICDVMGEGVYCSPGNGKYYIDLPSINALQAVSMGIVQENVWISDVCTHCNPHDFYSYRYHGDQSGRQGGFICLF